MTLSQARVAKLRQQRDERLNESAAERAEDQQREDDAAALGKQEGAKWTERDVVQHAAMKDLSAGSSGAIESVIWGPLMAAGLATYPDLQTSGVTSAEAAAFQAAFMEAVNEALQQVDEDL